MSVIQPRSKKSISGYSEETIGGWLVKRHTDGTIEATADFDKNAITNDNPNGDFS